jgi:hypothetical protein
LATWANSVSADAAKRAHEAVRRAILATSSPLARLVEGADFEIYLQGSYKNSTNVRGDSDVDIVVQLIQSFWRDISALPPVERALYESSFHDATYQWSAFRADVLTALQAYFGAADVSNDEKCLTVRASASRFSADVVAALEFRRYRGFRGLNDQDYDSGIKFLTRDGDRAVINYPKQHHGNGVAKNCAGRTDGQYKPGVRLFKNARRCLVERGFLSEEAAPSYFVECLLYNVPDEAFGGTWQQSYCAIVNWLRSNLSSYLVCQNEQVRLFGETPEQWSAERATEFVGGLIQLWNSS